MQIRIQNHFCQLRSRYGFQDRYFRDFERGCFKYRNRTKSVSRTIFVNYVLDTDFKIDIFVILSGIVLDTEIGQNRYLEPFLSITFQIPKSDKIRIQNHFLNYVLDTDFKIDIFVILSEVVLNTEIGQNPYLELFS